MTTEWNPGDATKFLDGLKEKYKASSFQEQQYVYFDPSWIRACEAADRFDRIWNEALGKDDNELSTED